jgi:glycosyltransferase involved in cell wall biosynthesis
VRIALVSEHASPLAVLGSVDSGGQNVHVAALATALGRRGHDVTVFTRADEPDLPAVVPFARGARVAHVPAGPAATVAKDELWPHMPAFAEGLARAWHRSAPHVVHSHFWMSGWAARRAARSIGLPVVHTYHALGSTKRRHQGAADTSPDCRLDVERELARGCERIVVTSNEELFELVRMGAASNHLSLVPCGVDLEHFRADGPVAPRPAPCRRVLVVSRLVERKGIGDVVAALAHVPGTELLVAGGPAREHLGDDGEATRLRALARRAGVADRVHLLGRVERADLPALYRSADAVVCSPWYEPFGLVALEAMACGAPVIASAVGGLVDTVIDGVTGVHVPPRDPMALVTALRRLLARPAERARLGRAGAARARARYGWDSIANETVRTYVAARAGRAADHQEVG